MNELEQLRAQVAAQAGEIAHLRREVDGLAILVESYSGGVLRRVDPKEKP